MPYNLQHICAEEHGRPTIDRDGDQATVRYSASGSFKLRFPGVLRISARCKYYHRMFVEDVGHEDIDGPNPARGGRWQVVEKQLPLTVTIRSPDGRVFTEAEITRSTLAKFRDLRGVTQGEWTYSVSGTSPTIWIEDEHTGVSPGDADVRIIVDETVPSESAAPLVTGIVNRGTTQNFAFDLFRIGEFRVRIGTASFFGIIKWQGTMRLRDPDGAVVATNSGRSLKFHVDARQLDKSRAADGGVRNWTLEVVTGANSAPSQIIAANVYGANQITVQTLQSRIDTLIGAGGSKIDIYGENVGGRARARIRIKDELSAETVDMHGLLDSLIKDNPQDADVNRNHPDIRVNTPYTIADRSEDYSGLRIVVADVKVKKISISLGASQRITPSIPAARILLETQGAIKIKIGGLTLATIKIRDNRLELEAGLTIDSDGKVAVQSWVSERLLDGDLHWTTAIISAIASAGIATAVAFGVVEYMEHEFNERIREGIKEAIESSVGRTPQILAMLNGADLTFRSVGLDGNNVRFEHIAPIEPDPKPSKIYKGIIGRSYTQLGPDAFSIMPPTMGDTWAQDNLQKIEHIVVVMMENRSFDHVLGHRSQAPDSSGIDGLSQPLIDHLGAAGFPIGKLRDSAFDFKTQFPLSVGHELHDVTTQVQHTMADQNGNLILSPKGFVDNFVENHRSLETATPGAKVNKFDVLGYYEGADLPFYRYLADNYTYCDRYYCSHPGPTLPNRMFSLVGDVQYDRVGEAIVDNNDGDNFYLSRALSIYDVLNRKGIDWRVYESYPSVTMLRMFARYATDDQKIVNINRLSADVAAGNLPPLTVVEPAMHHYPQNDDHPVADMINGQAFLKGVYDTLRSNDALWQKTLLVITYDEHGGFYDHVIPPTADLRAKRQIDMASDEIDTRGGGGRPVTSTNPSTTSTSIPRRGGLGDVLAGFPTDIFETPAATPPPPFINPVCATKFGVRVPTFLVSPWVPSGCAPDLVFDHCSILKTILARFVPGKSPFMTDRVASSRSFNALLTEATPRSVGPSPPIRPVKRGFKNLKRDIVTAPLSRAMMRDGNVDYHDLTGRLARMLGR